VSEILQIMNAGTVRREEFSFSFILHRKQIERSYERCSKSGTVYSRQSGERSAPLEKLMESDNEYFSFL